MKTSLLTLVFVLVCSTTWSKDNYGTIPPEPQIVRILNDGSLELTRIQSVCVPYQEEVEVVENVAIDVDGKTEYVKETKKVLVTKVKTVIQSTPLTLKPSILNAFETGGTAVELTSLKTRLAKPTLVVFGRDGRMIAPYFASVFKPGTLIVSAVLSPAFPQALPGVPAPALGVSKTITGDVTVRPVSQQSEAAAPTATPASTTAPEPSNDSPPGDTPSSQPPILIYARVSELGKINLRQYSEDQVEVDVQIQVMENGVPKISTMKQVRKIRHSESCQLDESIVDAHLADGNSIKGTDLQSVLKAAKTVVASVDGLPVGQFWLSIFKPDVVVLVPPIGVLNGGGCMSGMLAAPGPVEPAPAAPSDTVPVPKAESETNGPKPTE